jgi:hypothetical protein
MSADNLSIWRQVSKTDASATKTANLGGRQQTSIDGYWMIQKATEVFGPVGIGWGYEVLEDRWDEGAPFLVKPEASEPVTVTGKTHSLKLRLWYKLDGERGEITQYGHTPAVYRSKYGAMDDGEAPKKSLMDAIKKSLSMLGFSADVFRGQFDDREYVEQIRTEEAIRDAEDKDSVVEAKRTELAEYVKSNLAALDRASSVSEINGICKVSLRHLERQKLIKEVSDIADAGAKKIAVTGNEKKTTLEDKAA